MTTQIKEKNNKIFSWKILIFILIPILLITFLLSISFTYSLPNDVAHTLTYNNQKLTWDTNTTIDEKGSAKLDLFDEYYDSTNNENIIYPGSSGKSNIVLNNTDDEEITFKVFLYTQNDISSINYDINVTSEEITYENYEISSLDTNASNLISSNTIVKSITGQLSSNQQLEFNISWLWEFNNSTNNIIDTTVGNNKANGTFNDLKVSLLVTVETHDNEIIPTKPINNGMNVGLIAGLSVGGGILLAGIITLIIVLAKRKKEKEENK